MENDKGKFCGSCGANMPETAQFCPKCGGKAQAIPGQSAAQNEAAAPMAAQTGATPGVPSAPLSAQGAPSFGGAGFSAPGQTMPQAGLGMNWYKFIIYFSLFAQAAAFAILGVNLITGGFYGGFASDVYEFFGGLQALNITFGLACFVAAVMAIYVRQQLAHFKRDAPHLFYVFIIATNAAVLIYSWVCIFILSSATSSLFGSVSSVLTSYDATSAIFSSVLSTSISIIGGCAIWLGVNIAYFKKRAHLFVN